MPGLTERLPGRPLRASGGRACMKPLTSAIFAFMADTTDFASKFHFTQEMIDGPIYRKYEKAMRKIWTVDEFDFSGDAADWQAIDEQQRSGLLGVTSRFLAGEQAVTDELIPMLAASHALRRFDWIMFLSTFLLEEAKHAEFFMHWHKQVVGILEPDEIASPLARPHADDRPERPVRGARRAARGAAAVRRRADGGHPGRRRGRHRARLRPLLGLLQRLRRGRADDAVVRDRDRHLRRVGQVRRRSSRASA